MQFTDHMKSNFTPYIFASILTHLLLTAVFYVTVPEMESRTSIFNVDIVTPEQSAPPESAPPPGQETITPPVQKIKPPLVRRRIPSREELPPDTLHGGSTGTGDEEDTGQPGSKSPDKAEEPAAGTGREGLSFSPPVENGLEQDESGGAGLAPPSYLFDRETIEKFARKGEASADRGLTFDTAGFKNRGYMRMLKERIESIWKYPKEAARRGISGDLYMQFTIRKDGSLGEIELLRTSGHRALDEAAAKAIKKAAPFWPLPEDWDKDSLEIKGHFIYVFGSTIVM